MDTVEQSEQRDGIVAYRASAELIAEIEAVAAAEGISRSDVARRAVMRDLARFRVPDGMKPMGRELSRAGQRRRELGW